MNNYEIENKIINSYFEYESCISKIIFPTVESLPIFIHYSAYLNNISNIDDNSIEYIFKDLVDTFYAFTVDLCDCYNPSLTYYDFLFTHVNGNNRYSRYNHSMEIWLLLGNFFKELQPNVDYLKTTYDMESYYNNFMSYINYMDCNYIINSINQIKNNRNSNSNEIVIPTMKLKPHYYQEFGIKFMINKINELGFVLNADDVGLGKTIQAIATMNYYIQNSNISKIIVICKKSIKSQWLSEINKFTDLGDTFCICATDTKAIDRLQLYNTLSSKDKFILITNYHAFLHDTELISSLGIQFVIIDEVHSIKKREGVLNNNISRLALGLPTIYLTGTPIMSSPEDVFGIYQISNPNYFGDWNEFKSKYLIVDFAKHGEYVKGYRNVKELRNLIQYTIIRRTEKEVSLELPKVVINKIECDADSTQCDIANSIYKFKRNIVKEIERLKDKKNLSIEEKNELLRNENTLKALISSEQAVSNDPRLFSMSTSKMIKEMFSKFIKPSYEMSDKFEKIIDLVEDIESSGHKVIIFSKLKVSAKLIADDISKKLKIKTLLYTGDENDKERQENVTLFKTSDEYNVFIGTEAMAEGLNLQCAKYIINLDQPDSSAIKTQRIGRARRDGSEYSSVIVYDMITEFKSMSDDETISYISKDAERLENISTTQDLSDSLVSLTEEQRMELIKAMETNSTYSGISKFETTDEDTIIVRDYSSDRYKKNIEKFEHEVSISETKDTRDNSTIWVVKIKDNLDKQEFTKANAYMKFIGGYYSKFKCGFIFKENPSKHFE